MPRSCSFVLDGVTQFRSKYVCGQRRARDAFSFTDKRQSVHFVRAVLYEYKLKLFSVSCVFFFARERRGAAAFHAVLYLQYI